MMVLTFTNHTNKALNSLYLYDWNHAYSDNSTLLSKKLSEEFNFKFERSRSNEKGKTSIHQILSKQKLLKWHRLKKQIDIIVVDLIQHLLPGASQDIFANTCITNISNVRSYKAVHADCKQN